jgi:hypothetical protein
MIEVLIDSFPIEFQTVRVPRYRGVHSIPIQIYGSEATYQAIRALVTAKDRVKLEVAGPGEPGGNPAVARVQYDDLYVHSLRMHNDSTWLLELYDRRFELSRRIAALDVNMRFGDGAVPGTNFGDTLAALKALTDSIDVVKDNLDRTAFAQVPSLQLPEDTPLAGMGARAALDYLSDVAEVDLDVRGGKFRFADRSDIAGSPVLAQLSNLPWTSRPSFMIDAPTYKNLPKRFHVYFQERHTFRLVGRNGRATIAPPPGMDPSAFMALEQVYSYNGEYLTLDELSLAIFGLVPRGISDEAIASSYLTENLDGCSIGGQPLTQHSADARTFIGVIKRDWRRLWRIEAPLGTLGGWSDYEFGALRSDGSVSAQSVRCLWVEIYNTIRSQSGSFIGADASRNHPAPSPFVPVWDGGPESGVIRLAGVLDTSGGETKAGSIQHPNNEAHPGHLTGTLRVGVVTQVQDGSGQTIGFQGFTPIEIQNKTQAKFVQSFEIAIDLTATRRVPQTLDRFWLEDLGGFSNGTVDHHEIMAPILAYREFGNIGDGFGAVMNTAEVSREAENLKQQWMREFTLASEGDGVCESLIAFRDLDIQGPIRQITLEIDSDETGTYMRTRVEFGNLASPHARRNRRRQKQTFFSRTVSGKVVSV